MAPGKKKTGNDSKPSTSKGTANSEENIRPKRQATKKVKPGAMLEDDSSSDDFEPSPTKVVKKSPKKPSKKDPKKSQKKLNIPKGKKVLEPLDTNANFEDSATAMECFMCNTKFRHESRFNRHMKDTHQIDFMNKTPN